MADLYEDDSDLFVAGLAAGNQRVAVGIRGWVNRGMQNCRSVMIYLPNPPIKFHPESEIWAKTFLLHAKSKIRVQSAAIAEIRKPGKNVFKICLFIIHPPRMLITTLLNVAEYDLKKLYKLRKECVIGLSK